MQRLALLALTLLLASCTAHSPQETTPRMGSLVSPTRAQGAASYVLLNAVAATASVDSAELDCRGHRDAWVKIQFAGMAAGTDLVSALELRGGTDPQIASQVPLHVDGTLTEPVEAQFPTGLAVDAGDDGFTTADTFEVSTIFFVPIRNIPPFLSARYTRTSGGTGATVTVAVALD